MTPEEKRLKITAPIPLEKALNIYGVQSEAELELREAKECLERLELDSAALQPLTQYSVI